MTSGIFSVPAPFSTWQELEKTSHFVRENAPELLGGTLEKANEAVKKRAEEAKPTQTRIEAGSKGGRGNKAPDNIKCFSPNGTSAEYLTARIARDRPDVLERMKAGEFSSVRKAAMASGRSGRVDLGSDRRDMGQAPIKRFT